MKKLILTAILQIVAQFLIAQNFTETLIAENKDIKIVLLTRDTASTDQANWMQLKIKNKTRYPLFISDAESSINEEYTSAEGKREIDYGQFGQANKFYLFHNYYNLSDQNDIRKNFEILPNAERSTSEYISNYASVLIEPRKLSGKVCPLFQFNLTYSSQGKIEDVYNKGAMFCFFWKPDAQIPAQKLAQRLRDVLADSLQRRVNSYIISHLMKKSEVVDLISTDDFINMVLTEEKNITDKKILFLDELRARNAFPNRKLTDHYRKYLKNKPESHSSYELLHYWDNDLLYDLLKSSLEHYEICRILEKNSNIWSISPQKRSKIYEFLSKTLPFKKEVLPNNNNFKDWANSVKLMSISRDKRIIDYLVPFLENETAFDFADWSKYAHYGSAPKNPQPDTLQIRVCDVAYVSLLRAIGLTTHEIDLETGTKYSGVIYYQDFIEKHGFPESPLLLESYNFNLALVEKSIQLTPQSKVNIKKYINSILLNNMLSNIFFYLGLTLLTMHEMDAIRCREWRIFPGLSMLSDKLGEIIFVFAHIPIFFFIYWQLTHSTDLEAFMKGFNIFMLVHLGLHILFLKHKNNEFKDWISWTIIIGAGVCGLVGLILQSFNEL